MNWLSTYTTGTNPGGKPVISILAKRCYIIAPGRVEPAEECPPFVETDVYEDENAPQCSEVFVESQTVPYKPFTDVVIRGHVQCPRGKKAYHLDACVKVGQLSKTVRVFGQRKAQARTLRGIKIGDPHPFESVKISYRKAFGGMSRSKDGSIYSYYPNPIGVGFTLKGSFEEPEEIQIPQQEDPRHPLTEDNLVISRFEDWEQCPPPASFGWTRRNFYPRYTFAGVYPEHLPQVNEQMKEYLGGISTNNIPKLDFRFFQGASAGLNSTQLVGNEPVSLIFFDPDYPKFEFALPGETPLMTIDTGEGPVELKPALHTVDINKDENALTMIWRGAYELESMEQFAEFKKLETKVEDLT
ncbi:MAG: DUF2169 family type VI secretion system accessory protein [Chitinivibrionales bacterium]